MHKYIVQSILCCISFVNILLVLPAKVTCSSNPGNIAPPHLSEAEARFNKIPLPFLFPSSASLTGEKHPFLPFRKGNDEGILVKSDRMDYYNGFLATPAYTTGFYPSAVVVEDFNGDGKNDIVVSNFGNTDSQGSLGEITVLLVNGNGTLSKPYNIAAGTNPISVITGDFNRDGRKDLAVSNFGSNNVSVLLGNGNGSFRSTSNFKTGVKPFRLAASDFNNDGIEDLAVPNFGSGNVSILIGNGMGGFNNTVSVTTGNSPISVAAANFNSDGKEDIAAANFYDNTVSVLFGKGDGTFIKSVDFPTGIAPSMVTAKDFNSDGIPDMAIANMGSDTISVYLGEMQETFLVTHVNLVAGSHPSALIVEDFNNDGLKDLAITNFGNPGVTRVGDSLSVFLGNGNGTFHQTDKDIVIGVGPIFLTSGNLVKALTGLHQTISISMEIPIWLPPTLTAQI